MQDLKIFREESYFNNTKHTNYTVPFTDVFIKLRSGIRKSVNGNLNKLKKKFNLKT